MKHYNIIRWYYNQYRHHLLFKSGNLAYTHTVMSWKQRRKI